MNKINRWLTLLIQGEDSKTRIKQTFEEGLFRETRTAHGFALIRIFYFIFACIFCFLISLYRVLCHKSVTLVLRAIPGDLKKFLRNFDANLKTFRSFFLRIFCYISLCAPSEPPRQVPGEIFSYSHLANKELIF